MPSAQSKLTKENLQINDKNSSDLIERALKLLLVKEIYHMQLLSKYICAIGKSFAIRIPNVDAKCRLNGWKQYKEQPWIAYEQIKSYVWKLQEDTLQL